MGKTTSSPLFFSLVEVGKPREVLFAGQRAKGVVAANLLAPEPAALRFRQEA